MEEERTRLTDSQHKLMSDETRIEDDEWTPSYERITKEQIDSMLALLATPCVESDLQIFTDDDEPSQERNR